MERKIEVTLPFKKKWKSAAFSRIPPQFTYFFNFVTKNYKINGTFVCNCDLAQVDFDFPFIVV